VTPDRATFPAETGPSERSNRRSRRLIEDKIVRAGAIAVLVLVSFWVCLTGVFLIPAGPVLFGANCSWSWPYVLVTNLGLVWLAKRIDESELIVVVPAVAWILTFFVLGRQGPTGHILEPAGAAGYGFLIVGFAVFLYAVFSNVVPRGRRTSGASRSPATHTEQ
jgi:hypothetical protein